SLGLMISLFLTRTPYPCHCRGPGTRLANMRCPTNQPSTPVVRPTGPADHPTPQRRHGMRGRPQHSAHPARSVLVAYQLGGLMEFARLPENELDIDAVLTGHGETAPL